MQNDLAQRMVLALVSSQTPSHPPTEREREKREREGQCLDSSCRLNTSNKLLLQTTISFWTAYLVTVGNWRVSNSLHGMLVFQPISIHQKAQSERGWGWACAILDSQQAPHVCIQGLSELVLQLVKSTTPSGKLLQVRITSPGITWHSQKSHSHATHTTPHYGWV